MSDRRMSRQAIDPYDGSRANYAAATYAEMMERFAGAPSPDPDTLELRRIFFAASLGVAKLRLICCGPVGRSGGRLFHDTHLALQLSMDLSMLEALEQASLLPPPVGAELERRRIVRAVALGYSDLDWAIQTWWHDRLGKSRFAG